MIENESSIEMKDLRIILIAFLKIGWLKCCFTDRFGALHHFEEQVPLVTGGKYVYFDENTEFPQEGYLNCASLRLSDEIFKIDIGTLLLRDQNGDSIFEVYSSQLK